MFIPNTMSGRQHGLIQYLLTFKIIWEGNHVEQIVSEFLLVDEFWCKKKEVWNFSKIFVYLILGQHRGHRANNSSFLPSLKFCHQGIISDLFPGVVLPKSDYEVFMEVLNENIRKMKLQPVPWFIRKIIQVGSLGLHGQICILLFAKLRN